MYNHSQHCRLIAVIGLIACFYGKSSERKENDLRNNRLAREDSRWAIDVNAQRRYIANSKNYKKPKRVIKSQKVQDLDDRKHVQFSGDEIPVHLRSCSCCQPPIPIEGVPDKPWYVRFFSCCCHRDK